MRGVTCGFERGTLQRLRPLPRSRTLLATARAPAWSIRAVAASSRRPLPNAISRAISDVTRYVLQVFEPYISKADATNFYTRSQQAHYVAHQAYVYAARGRGVTDRYLVEARAVVHDSRPLIRSNVLIA